MDGARSVSTAGSEHPASKTLLIAIGNRDLTRTLPGLFTIFSYYMVVGCVVRRNQLAGLRKSTTLLDRKSMNRAMRIEPNHRSRLSRRAMGNKPGLMAVLGGRKSRISGACPGEPNH